MSEKIIYNVDENEIRKRITLHMESRNMSNKMLSDLSHVPPTTISSFRTNNNAPTLPTLIALCNGLGISLSTLVNPEGFEQVQLSAEERRLFSYWAFLTGPHREVLMNTAMSLVEAQKSEKDKEQE